MFKYGVVLMYGADFSPVDSPGEVEDVSLLGGGPGGSGGAILLLILSFGYLFVFRTKSNIQTKNGDVGERAKREQ